MYKTKTQRYIEAYKQVFDMASFVLAWIVAYQIRFKMGIEAPKGIPSEWVYLKITPFLLIINVFVFNFLGFYRNPKRRSAVLESVDFIIPHLASVFSFIVFTYFYEEYRYSRLVLLIYALIAPVFFITGRSIARKILRIYRRTSSEKSVLIIARDHMIENALSISNSLSIKKESIENILLPYGSISPEEQKIVDKNGYKVIETPSNWANFFTENNYQSVIIALPAEYQKFIDENFEKMVEQIYDIRILPDLDRYLKLSPGVELIDGKAVISIHESPMRGWGLVYKRLLDMISSFIGILLLSPILILIAILVKLSSKGPILYRQQRMGIDGSTFDCLKFRSMPVTSENETGAVWTKKGDTRATAVGSFIRKYSVDELPQLINVLKGDMSLVGPRPERPVFVHEFRHNIPGYMLRHKVRAGMTGWAQVNGLRGDTSLSKRIEYDLWYIKNWSFWLDIKILFMTIGEVINSKTAR